MSDKYVIGEYHQEHSILDQLHTHDRDVEEALKEVVIEIKQVLTITGKINKRTKKIWVKQNPRKN